MSDLTLEGLIVESLSVSGRIDPTNAIDALITVLAGVIVLSCPNPGAKLEEVRARLTDEVVAGVAELAEGRVLQ